MIYTNGNYNLEEHMDILKKINKLRLDKNWSVYRLSVESGISQSTLTNMFNRETLPSITTLECLCNAFGITMSEFFSDNKKSNNSYEAELLELFSKIPEDSKRSIITIMRDLQR